MGNGVVIWWEAEGCFGIKYPDKEILAISEFDREGDLKSLGNIYEHPDWEN